MHVIEGCMFHSMVMIINVLYYKYEKYVYLPWLPNLSIKNPAPITTTAFLKKSKELYYLKSKYVFCYNIKL